MTEQFGITLKTYSLREFLSFLGGLWSAVFGVAKC